jgi:hypothetical protein
MTKKKEKQMVLVTTERKGVFVGYLESYDVDRRIAILTDVVMAIRWGTTNGLLELTDTGPTSSSKISAVCPRARLELCECVLDVSEEAERSWLASR